MTLPRSKRSFGTVCCVPDCKNTSKFNREVSWHSFPHDVKLLKEWIRRISRKGVKGKFGVWCPTKYHKICGAHFNASGRKKYEDQLPTIFPHKIYHHGPRLTGSKKIKGQVSFKDAFPSQYDSTSTCIVVPTTLNDCTGNLTGCEQSIFMLDIEIGANVEVISREKPKIHNTSVQCCLTERPVVNEPSPINFHDYSLHKEDLTALIQSLKKDLDEAIHSNLEITALNNQLKEALKNSKKEIFSLGNKYQVLNARLKIEKVKSPLRENFRLKTILDEDEKKRFYTGFENKIRLQIFLDFVIDGFKENNKKTTTRGRPKVLELEDELFVVLCRLRLGLLSRDLAYRFQVSEGTINNIWQFWLGFLSSYLTQVPIWPSGQTVQDFMPEEFKNIYPTTRVILDCTELFIENPSEFRVQSDTYSSYKSHNTAKGLIGITPNGFVSLVSDLAPGRLSDKVITNDSGLYQMLESEDSVMADRGFLIEESLSVLGVGLNIPPFLKGKEQFSSKEIELTVTKAKLRIHVESVIREVKKYRILKFVFPNAMADKLNSIWKICCYLCNFTNEPLLDRRSTECEDLILDSESEL